MSDRAIEEELRAIEWRLAQYAEGGFRPKPTDTIAFSRYLEDVMRLLGVIRRAPQASALRQLALRCARRAAGADQQAAHETDPELRGRLLGQARTLEWVAARLETLSRASHEP